MDVAAEECPDVLRKLVDNVENGRLICRLSETDKTLLPIYGISKFLSNHTIVFYSSGMSYFLYSTNAGRCWGRNKDAGEPPQVQ